MGTLHRHSYCEQCGYCQYHLENLFYAEMKWKHGQPLKLVYWKRHWRNMADINNIRQDFLPWKPLISFNKYYYMWKTTYVYAQQNHKATTAESKLIKCMYIPIYKQNPNQIASSNDKPGAVNAAMGNASQPHNPPLGQDCESCYATQSHQWYS